MVSAKADGYLRGLRFDPGAGTVSNYLPLTMLYWADELNEEVLYQWGDDDKFWVLILIRIRCELWKGNDVGAENLEIWDHCRAAYPECPIFQRVDADESTLAAQLALEANTQLFLDAAGFVADEPDPTRDADSRES